MYILLNTPIQTGACVPPHRLRIPRHPFVPPCIVPMQWHPLPHAFVKHSQQRIANSFDPQPVTNLVPASTIYTSVHTPVPPWSHLRLDVSAPTFPSYFLLVSFHSQFTIDLAPIRVFFPTFPVVWSLLSHGAMRSLFCALSFQFLCRFFFRCLPLACPQLPVTQPDDIFLPFSVLQPMPSGNVR